MIEELALKFAGHQADTYAAIHAVDDAAAIHEAANIKTRALNSEIDKLDALGKHIRAKAGPRTGKGGFGDDWDSFGKKWASQLKVEQETKSWWKETPGRVWSFQQRDLLKVRDEVIRTSDRWRDSYGDVVQQSIEAVGLKGIPAHNNPYKHFEDMIDSFGGDGAKIADYLSENLTHPFHRSVIALLKPHLPENLRVS